MLSTSALRSTRALTLRFHPGVLTCTASMSTTTTARPAKPQRTPAQQQCTRPSILQNPIVRISISCKRNASTTSPTTQTTAPPPPSSTPETLTWNRFLALRKTRRRVSLVFSILSALGTTAFGITTLTNSNFDTWGAQTTGLDPTIVFGLGTIAFATVGWLIGPFFGSAVFRTYFRGIVRQLDAKEKQFFARIKKHRADPAEGSSMANPVPDYYGEKIGSVGDYRRWLKDQRAFRLKRGQTSYK